eukprot:COSAG02_NODE_201_length_29473_cov_135.510213_16_plen_48_part_00
MACVLRLGNVSLTSMLLNEQVVDDCCAAATDTLHKHELEIINMIYCA